MNDYSNIYYAFIAYFFEPLAFWTSFSSSFTTIISIRIENINTSGRLSAE